MKVAESTHRKSLLDVPNKFITNCILFTCTLSRHNRCLITVSSVSEHLLAVGFVCCALQVSPHAKILAFHLTLAWLLFFPLVMHEVTLWTKIKYRSNILPSCSLFWSALTLEVTPRSIKAKYIHPRIILTRLFTLRHYTKRRALMWRCPSFPYSEDSPSKAKQCKTQHITLRQHRPRRSAAREQPKHRNESKSQARPLVSVSFTVNVRCLGSKNKLSTIFSFILLQRKKSHKAIK